MREYEEQFTEIWNKYEKSRGYLDQKGLVRKTDECWRFYLGDQWHGLESGEERLPSLNFIRGVVKYKTAVVAQNAMTASYSPMEKTKNGLQICELLNQHFRQNWEIGKMDKKLWDIVKGAQIQGDSYLFYGTSDMTDPQILSNVNVLFSDEQEADIQKQKYIMIYERRFVKDIREEAQKYGLKQEEIDRIVSDEEVEHQLGNITELKQSTGIEGKCASILYMEKGGDGVVSIARSTKTCIYQPKMRIQASDNEGNYAGQGLKSYPIASFLWEKIPNNARGQSEVRNLIPNQLELNKTLARRSMSVKMCAFPKIAYDANAIINPEAIDHVGQKIQVNNAGAWKINEMISYLNPASMSGDARALSDELLGRTRDLAGAGDAAMGAVDPTKASGAAIIAVKNQNELPLNENVATKVQFVEDLALLWFDMWVAYNPNGLVVEKGTDETGKPLKEKIPSEALERLRVNVRVDVSQSNPFSKLAQEQALEQMLQGGKITFEEYIEALDDDSNVPKAKIKDIMEKRKQQGGAQKEEQQLHAIQPFQGQNQVPAQFPGIEDEREFSKEVMPNEMPGMQ